MRTGAVTNLFVCVNTTVVVAFDLAGFGLASIEFDKDESEESDAAAACATLEEAEEEEEGFDDEDELADGPSR